MATKGRETNLTRFQIIVRCLPGAVLLLLGVLALYVVQTTEFSILDRPSRDILAIIGVTNVAIYFWVRVVARVGFRSQITALALLYGLQLGLYAAVRIDGFMGDGRLILAWRWAPTTGQSWNIDETIESSAAANVTADLVSVTEFDHASFRGADRTGTVRTVRLAREWTKPPRQLWRRPIGLGWSSFAVVGDFCVTQEQRGEFESVVCYELRTGREVWRHSDLARFDEVTGGTGPRATPTIHGGRVFTLGATGILNCLDGRDGRRIWSANILLDNQAENTLFGMSGSPLVVNGLVVVSPGGKKGSLVAYDMRTGARVWAGDDAEASYSSPQYAPFSDHPQILNFNAEGLSGHDAESGGVLWRYTWVSNPAEKNNVCQPVVFLSDDKRPNRVFISSSYGMGCALLDIVRRDGAFEVRVSWRSQNLKAKFSSVVRRGMHVYGLDERILACIDVATGERCWKGGRYGYGQLVLADDLLIVQAESGEIALVEATPERHRELGRFAALNHRTWNHPVVSEDLLLVRNDREAACYELPRSAP
jgi:outer membrane protein assembly factor BamB